MDKVPALPARSELIVIVVVAVPLICQPPGTIVCVTPCWNCQVRAVVLSPCSVAKVLAPLMMSVPVAAVLDHQRLL